MTVKHAAVIASASEAIPLSLQAEAKQSPRIRDCFETSSLAMTVKHAAVIASGSEAIPLSLRAQAKQSIPRD